MRGEPCETMGSVLKNQTVWREPYYAEDSRVGARKVWELTQKKKGGRQNNRKIYWNTNNYMDQEKGAWLARHVHYTLLIKEKIYS